MKNLNELSAAIHENNISKGFYEKEKNIGEMLALIHSEVSKNQYSSLSESQMNVLMGWSLSKDFIKDYKRLVKGSFEEEMADIIIRVLDLCAHKKINIEQHIAAKIRYNAAREYKHGKKY